MIKKMKVLAVGGNFDDEGGRPSGYMAKLFSYLPEYFSDIRIVNGGSFDILPGTIDPIVSGDYDVVFWFANVSNDKPKLLEKIKRKNPKCILISSKNNTNAKYSFMHLMARALKVKSNLLLEIHDRRQSKIMPTNIVARVLDPLGNCFAPFTDSINKIADPLYTRVQKLHEFTRVGSVRVGDAIEVPDEKKFFFLVISYSAVFHDLMHTENQDRFLGNASFRCMKGMPSFRGKDHIFVSRRNIDKRYIGPEGFVACDPDPNPCVKYYGEHKPSVDTPIQLALYKHFEDVNYMVHSHTYVMVKNGHWGSPAKTKNPIPCGAIEEIEEIIGKSPVDGLFPEKDCFNFCVNLKGHGCLIMAKDLDYFRQIKFEARKFPEMM